ncbi:MAG: DUF554 domain-containing protein [Oscillospiraceae bacterium]|nr:DUF554 domain-containing protein [Oscillospiraceae bacterium]
MVGLGTIVNTAAILAGGGLGLLFGSFLKERHQETLRKTCGLSVLFIAVAGAMEGMLSASEGGALTAGRSMLVVLCLVLGGLIGELLNIEGGLERLGRWLREKTGSSGDKTFVEGFVTATLTVCVGAMAVIGSLQDGLQGDHTLLFTKAILDFAILIVLAGTLGKGCLFSALPVLALQGGITLLARLLQPVLTDTAMVNLNLVGSILIFCVGVNLFWGKQIRVANLLPAIVLAVGCAFLPLAL